MKTSTTMRFIGTGFDDNKIYTVDFTRRMVIVSVPSSYYGNDKYNGCVRLSTEDICDFDENGEFTNRTTSGDLLVDNFRGCGFDIIDVSL